MPRAIWRQRRRSTGDHHRRYLGRGEYLRAQAPLRRQQRVFHHAARFDQDATQGSGCGKLLHSLSGRVVVGRLSLERHRELRCQSLLGSQPDDLHGWLPRNGNLPGHDVELRDVVLGHGWRSSDTMAVKRRDRVPHGSMALRRPRRGQVPGLDPDRVGHALCDVVSDPDVVVFRLLSSALPGVRRNLGDHLGRHRHRHRRHADRGLQSRIGRVRSRPLDGQFGWRRRCVFHRRTDRLQRRDPGYEQRRHLKPVGCHSVQHRSRQSRRAAVQLRLRIVHDLHALVHASRGSRHHRQRGHRHAAGSGSLGTLCKYREGVRHSLLANWQ
jgi:hypothetical protein